MCARISEVLLSEKCLQKHSFHSTKIHEMLPLRRAHKSPNKKAYFQSSF